MDETRAASPIANPMPGPPQGECYVLKVVGRLEGQMTVNGFAYRNDKPPGGGTITDQIDLVASFTDVAGPLSLYAAAVSIDWTFQQIECWSPTTPKLATYVYTAPGPIGEVPLPRLPNQNAVVIMKTTTLRGKHGRGRISVPAVPQLWVTGTNLTNRAAHDNLAAIMSAKLQVDQIQWTPVLLAKGPAPTFTLGVSDLRGAFVRPILGTIRRRKPGVGV